jgi:hypothetical protein
MDPRAISSTYAKSATDTPIRAKLEAARPPEPKISSQEGLAQRSRYTPPTITRGWRLLDRAMFYAASMVTFITAPFVAVTVAL